VRIPKHVSGLFISLWEPANSLFVTPTGKRLHAGYVQKAEARKTYHLIPQLATNNTCMWFNGDLLHTYHKLIWHHSLHSTVILCGPKNNLYIKDFDTSDADLSFISGSNNWINPTYMNHVSIHVRLVWRRKFFFNLSERLGLL